MPNDTHNDMNSDMQNDPKISLDDAYGLKTPEDNIALYRDWAETYDAEFAQDRGYQYPQVIADIYARHAKPNDNPILDVGSGTGLVASALQEHHTDDAQLTIDGVDISPEMLAVSRAKGVYRHLFEGGLDAIDRPIRTAIWRCGERWNLYPRTCGTGSIHQAVAPMPRWRAVCDWRQWNGV